MRKEKPKQLTQLTVEKLRYNPDWGNPNEIADHLYPQLRLVVQKSNARSFAVRTRIGGKTAKITLKEVGLDLKKARDAARDLLAEISDGHDPRVAKRRAKATTLGGVTELYLGELEAEASPKTIGERTRHLHRDWKPLHHRPVAEIKRAEIAGRLLEIKSEHGPIAANRSRATLFNLMEWSVSQGLIEANVVASTKRPAKERARERVLSVAELREIWDATEGSGDYNAIARLLILTGQRREEVGGMRWSELDLEAAMWSLPSERTKNGLPHLVPLPRQAVEILQRFVPQEEKEKDRKFVFGKGEGAYSGWSRSKKRLDRKILARRRTKLEEAGGDPSEAKPFELWQFQRDIRRSVVTGMNELGIGAPHVVEAIVNHVSGEAKRGVAGVYNKAQYLKERTTALQSWANYLTAEPADKVVPST